MNEKLTQRNRYYPKSDLKYQLEEYKHFLTGIPNNEYRIKYDECNYYYGDYINLDNINTSKINNNYLIGLKYVYGFNDGDYNGKENIYEYDVEYDIENPSDKSEKLLYGIVKNVDNPSSSTINTILIEYIKYLTTINDDGSVARSDFYISNMKAFVKRNFKWMGRCYNKKRDIDEKLIQQNIINVRKDMWEASIKEHYQ